MRPTARNLKLKPLWSVLASNTLRRAGNALRSLPGGGGTTVGTYAKDSGSNAFRFAGPKAQVRQLVRCCISLELAPEPAAAARLEYFVCTRRAHPGASINNVGAPLYLTTYILRTRHSFFIISSDFVRDTNKSIASAQSLVSWSVRSSSRRTIH